MRRALLLSAIVVLFLAVSAVLSRAFSAENAERSAIIALLHAEARGDALGAMTQVLGCRASSACRTRARTVTDALRHSGSVAILKLDPAMGFSLGGGDGTARVAWTVGGSLPIVQCVRVRRTGSALSGLRIELLTFSARIRSNADCPRRF